MGFSLQTLLAPMEAGRNSVAAAVVVGSVSGGGGGGGEGEGGWFQ